VFSKNWKKDTLSWPGGPWRKPEGWRRPAPPGTLEEGGAIAGVVAPLVGQLHPLGPRGRAERRGWYSMRVSQRDELGGEGLGSLGTSQCVVPTADSVLLTYGFCYITISAGNLATKKN